MKQTPLSSRHLALLAAVVGLMLCVAPAARAFTIDNQSNTNADGSARYADPGTHFDTSSDGKTTFRQGNTTFQFGQSQPFNQKYNSDRMFYPNGRLGEDR